MSTDEQLTLNVILHRPITPHHNLNNFDNLDVILPSRIGAGFRIIGRFANSRSVNPLTSPCPLRFVVPRK